MRHSCISKSFTYLCQKFLNKMTKQETIKGGGVVASVEVFTTNIQSKIQADSVLNLLENRFQTLKINFDLNEVEQPYPCGHTVVRVEGNTINAENIIAIINQSGFRCDILEDKVCR